MVNQTEATAQYYYELGFSIFPLKPKSKEPMGGSWLKYQTKRASPGQISKWWHESEGLNIAIVCGKISGIVVVDIDHQEKLPPGLFFPPTASVKTGRGYHYYYRLNEGQKIKTTKYNWGEIRGEGGYVVAPCSTHPSGIVYEWVDGGWPTLEGMEYFPVELLEQIGANEQGVVESKLYESAFNGQIGEGLRNSTMASVIGKLLKDFPNQNEWQTTVWEIVKNVNEKRCVPPLTIDELDKTFQSICKTEQKSENKSEEKEFKIVTGAELVKKEVKANPYLIHSVIYEGAINAITADTGKGKSLLALKAACSIATGEKLFDRFESKKCKVLIIDQEMDADLLIDRYKQIVGVENPVIDYLYEQTWIINEKKDFEWLKKTIKESGYGCVIFDTLTNIHTYDENKAEDMRELNRLMLQLIHETGVTIIYLHHHRKLQKGEKQTQALSRGSTEIGAKMASHILLNSSQEKDSQGRTVTSMTIRQMKSRRPESIESVAVDVIHDPKQKTTTWEFKGEIKDEPSAAARACNEIERLLRENKEMTMNELIEECTVGASSVRLGAKILVKNNMINVSFATDASKPNTKVYSLNKKDAY